MRPASLKAALASCVLATAAPVLGQTYGGTLVDEAGQTLIGATVEALPNGNGTATDVDGTWTLDAPGADSLRFSYVGYAARTLAVGALPQNTPLVLAAGQTLSDVTVTARQGGTFTSTLGARNVETVTSHELKKAPCCNLGESFETNAAVDVSYRDAATGAREIQLLGLRGPYAQLLLEKRPTLYGLASPIALDLISGTWINSIQIGKGASSVQTGPNALAGQINTELDKPRDSERLGLNAYAAGAGRFEANAQASKTWDDRHASGLLLHGSENLQAHDRNRDGFYDQVGRRTLSGLARHFVSTDNWAGQLNVWGATDRRRGGQTDHDAGDLEGHDHSGELYEIRQDNDRLEAFAKTAYLGFARAATSIGVIGGATYHRLDNRYGDLDHAGEQRSGYLSVLFSSYLRNTAHTYTVGAAYRDDDYRERLGASDYDRRERAPGAFAEYTYERPATGEDWGLSVIAGLRVDHHTLGGAQALPRLNLRVSPTPQTALRASAGRAYRSAQVIAENLRFLPSSRRFEFREPLRLETGWTYGVALTQNFGTPATAKSFTRSAQVNIDLYATLFDNVAVLDQESTTGFTLVGNGPARSLAALASVSASPLRGLDVKVAYKYVDSRITYLDGVERDAPYVPRQVGLVSVDYEWPRRRWRVNANLNVMGPQRLPGEDAFATFPIEADEVLTFESPTFALLNAQLTYVVNDRFEVYAGGQNLGDYRQTDAVLGAANPSARYFDASRVYAPLMGRMGFVGVRFEVE